MWLGCYYLYNFALKFTSPGSDIAIFNSSAVFGYILSVIFLKESITSMKVFAVVLCLFGVALITYGDEDILTNHHVYFSLEHILGDALSLGSAVLYASYLVHLSWFLGEPNVIVVTLYTLVVGLFTLLIFWIVIPVLDILHLEAFELPPNMEAWIIFLLAVILCFAENIVVYYGVAYTSPLFIIIAGTLTIPVTVGVDDLISFETNTPIHYSVIRIAGMVLIIFGFITLYINFPTCCSPKPARNRDFYEEIR
jgi:drug/metabolite transporter (DMT)-like permease